LENVLHDPAPIAWALKHPGVFYSTCLAVFFLAALLWWLLPLLQRRPSARKGLRTDLTLFYTGSVVAAGIIGAIIQFQANVERDQQQQRFTLSSENAKRFDSAVGQLQKHSDLVELGAVNALGELSKQDGFYWSSIAMLSAYLRHAVRASDGINSAVVAGAFYILSVRNWESRNSEPFPLDFSSLNLKGLHYSQLQLWGSNFQLSDLSGAILPGAKFESADFSCANFENAIFQPSYLQNATDPAELGPKLANANFRNANLIAVLFKSSSVDVENACFEGANLGGADISGFDLSKVTGLDLNQIRSTKKHPDVSDDFHPKPCMAFKDLCPTNIQYQTPPASRAKKGD